MSFILNTLEIRMEQIPVQSVFGDRIRSVLDFCMKDIERLPSVLTYIRKESHDRKHK